MSSKAAHASTSNPQRRRPQLPELSRNSTPAQPRGLWSSQDFMLGAGSIIIQPATQRVCILEDIAGYAGQYFLPRGRKDVGESLEETALREAHEESGYRAEFLPALHPMRQPRAPGVAPTTLEDHLTTEAFYISLSPFFDRHRRRSEPPPVTGGEYLVFWFLCQMSANATLEQGTRMPDEQGFVTHLLPFDEALAKMQRHGDYFEYIVLRRGIDLWLETQAMLDDRPTGPEVEIVY